MLTSQTFRVNPYHWSISDLQIRACDRNSSAQFTGVIPIQGHRALTAHIKIQQGAGSLTNDHHQLSATLHFPISEQSKHLSLFPGTLLPGVHITKWMCITRSMCQHHSWEWRAQDLWKGKNCFVSDTAGPRWGVGTLPWCGRPALLHLWEILFCKIPCITNQWFQQRNDGIFQFLDLFETKWNTDL